MMPYMNKNRIFEATKELFINFTEIHDHMLTFQELKDKDYNMFENIELGSAIMKFGKFAVTIWIGKNNVSLMVSKEEVQSILSLI